MEDLFGVPPKYRELSRKVDEVEFLLNQKAVGFIDVHDKHADLLITSLSELGSARGDASHAKSILQVYLAKEGRSEADRKVFYSELLLYFPTDKREKCPSLDLLATQGNVLTLIKSTGFYDELQHRIESCINRISFGLNHPPDPPPKRCSFYSMCVIV